MNLTLKYHVEPFQIKHKGKYYSFPEVDITLEAKVDNGDVIIGKPKCSENYQHPIIFDDGGFGEDFNLPYKCERLEAFKVISRMFRMAERILYYPLGGHGILVRDYEDLSESSKGDDLTRIFEDKAL